MKSTEGPICQAHTFHREVCYLPGAQIRDITSKLPSLVKTSDNYPLLFFHVGGEKAVVQRLLKETFGA